MMNKQALEIALRCFGLHDTPKNREVVKAAASLIDNALQQADLEAVKWCIAFDNMHAQNQELEKQLESARARANRAYTERAACAGALARMALKCGFKAGWNLDSQEGDEEWRKVLYVDTPNGQVSWHIAPDDQSVLNGLPIYTTPCDGTFKSRELGWAIWHE